MLNSDYECSMFDDNMIFIIAAAVVVAVIILVIIFAYICRRYKDKLLSKVTAFRKKFFWNGFVRSL